MTNDTSCIPDYDDDTNEGVDFETIFEDNDCIIVDEESKGNENVA